ncbi:hypothetical protein H6G76_29155 [Nostoc sp. FACHB-152]|uniref:hypothetical protein n=1 Tax=unclassified Nostoc TaxID=2593658 RepID=UPI00168544E8|nr:MULTISPECIES: hypothetical protein [unclassified Nostoc]MBD2451127.1 hypothetical protein [Nostoc sp. FACHB-152]MBD2473153.1 hypothetical protein [Nostoc sp. FACHB-145]
MWTLVFKNAAHYFKSEKKFFAVHIYYIEPQPVEQGVGGRVWGVGKTVLGEDSVLSQHKRLKKAGLPTQEVVGADVSLHPTPHTPHPAPTGLGNKHLEISNQNRQKITQSLIH